MDPSTSTLVNIYLPSPNAFFPEFPFELRPYTVQSPSCQEEWLMSPLCKPLADYCLGPGIPCSRGNSKVPQMALSCALTLTHLGSPENPLLAPSSESCAETSLTSQSHPSLPSQQSPAQGKRGLWKRRWFVITRKSKFLQRLQIG